MSKSMIESGEVVREEKDCVAFILENTWLVGMAHGWGNGYVAVPKSHKLYGVDYNDIHSDTASAHGGLTFSAQDGDLWVFGFDTCHYMDNESNCDKQFVTDESTRLLEQIVKL